MATTRATARAAANPPARANPMEMFYWEGTDKRGVKIKGELQAKSANFVRAELRKQNINPIVVKPKPKPLFGKAGKRITSLDITIFSRQLATMLQSGVPMVQSFEILAGGNVQQLNDSAQASGVRDLRQSALLKVRNGVTSLAEINRVTKD
jgi:type IV pilus assembly protein PilC